MDTGAIVSVTVQDASDGDSATLPETLLMTAEQVELVQPDGPCQRSPERASFWTGRRPQHVEGV